MNIFAIDFGNKQIKMKSDKGEYCYPSSYLDAEQVFTGGLGTEKINDNYSFRLPDDGNYHFLWGAHLEEYNLPESLIDTYGRTERLKQRKAIRLLKFALGRLAFDFLKKDSETFSLEVHLVIGLKISDFYKGSDTIERLKSLLIGEHQLIVNEKEITINILSEEHLLFIPQYMGSLFNLALDSSQESLFSKGRIGVMDIGGGTILANRVVALNPSLNGIERFEGIQLLIKEIARKVNTTKLFLVDQLLHNVDSQGEYHLIQGVNQVNITETVNNEKDRYTRFVFSPLIGESFPDIEGLDLIIITGGGALLLSREALKEEVTSNYFEKLHFIEEPILVNVRGFYKSGLLKWEENLPPKTSPIQNEGFLLEEEKAPDSSKSSEPVPETIESEDEIKSEVLKAKADLEKLKSELGQMIDSDLW